MNPGKIQLYIAHQQQLKASSPSLGLVTTAEEHSIAAKYKSLERRHEYLSGRSLLRHALERQGYQDLPSDFIKNVKGSFKPMQSTYFNISHSDGMTVVALGSAPIGVDIELTIRNISKRTLLRYCLPEDLPSKKINPVQLWCLKESFAKATGKGLGPELKQLRFSTHFNQILQTPLQPQADFLYFEFLNYSLAVCSLGEILGTEVYRLEDSQFQLQDIALQKLTKGQLS